MYVAKKRVKIVYEIQDDILCIYTIAIWHINGCLV
jgi:hypothetical protein